MLTAVPPPPNIAPPARGGGGGVYALGMTILPTGQRFLIESGRYTAVVTEVGATLRSFTVDGAETLYTFAEDEPAGSKGRQLVPWPNRIRDGRYTYEGVTRQLAVNEIDRNTALHGLAQGAAWKLVRQASDEVVLSTVIYPQQGWDWVLEVTIGHRVDEAGLTVTVEARNLGAGTAPYGYGTHPYLSADVATTRLTLPFAEELIVDPERLLQEADGYKQRLIATAEGDASRFKQILTEYAKAPEVTRNRMYLETMQQIYANTSKVMVDAKGQGNLLYLPLDKLMQAANYCFSLRLFQIKSEIWLRRTCINLYLLL